MDPDSTLLRRLPISQGIKRSAYFSFQRSGACSWKVWVAGGWVASLERLGKCPSAYRGRGEREEAWLAPFSGSLLMPGAQLSLLLLTLGGKHICGR